MSHTIGILRENQNNETRVCATPETVAKLVKKGLSVLIESDAGSLATHSNEAYEEAGEGIAADKHSVLSQAAILFKIQPPEISDIEAMRSESMIISPLYSSRTPDLIEKIKAKNITVFSLNQLPRIARAQSMDILSSMSSIAGYKSIILAADHLKKLFPMMTTAAGTILPVKVIVIGAGVAGLQAIATAKRLGAVVKGFDTRPVTAEQVKSLGAEFVSMETSHDASQDTGGYAKEQSAEFYQQEQDIISQHLSDADVIVTTALIPNKTAPVLITEQMVKDMQPGSVIVDLAVEQGGNCSLTEKDKIAQHHDVTIVGLSSLPSLLPYHASQLFSNNCLNFLNYILPQIEAGQFDYEDDIIQSCLINTSPRFSPKKEMSHA